MMGSSMDSTGRWRRSGGFAARACVRRWPPARLVGRQQPTFRAGIDLVNFGVTVTDQRGNFLTDLTPRRLRDLRGRPEADAHVLRPRRRGRRRRPSCTSACCSTPAAAWARTSSWRAPPPSSSSTRCRDAEDMTLVDFDTEVRVATLRPAGLPAAGRAHPRAASPTAGRRCTTRSASISTAPRRTRAARSWCSSPTAATRAARISFGDVMTLLRASDVTVYAVGFLEHQPAACAAEQRLRLTQIADATGGAGVLPVRR